MEYWPIFETEGSYTSPPHHSQPTQGSPEYPGYFITRTFDDTFVYGVEPACLYEPDYPFSSEPQAHCLFSLPQTDDGPSDQNNNDITTYCDLTSYQGLVAQEEPAFPIGESFFAPSYYATDEVPPQLVDDISQMAESSSQPPIETKIKFVLEVSDSFHLPLKKRSSVRQWDTDSKYPCPFCDRLFDRKSALTQHRNVYHSGPLEQRCDICGKRFRLQQELEEHRLRHSEQNKKFECEHCPKKFYYKNDMIRHVSGAHMVAPHSCQTCDKRFVRLDHLRKHEKRHSKIPKNVDKKVPKKRRKNEVESGGKKDEQK